MKSEIKASGIGQGKAWDLEKVIKATSGQLLNKTFGDLPSFSWSGVSTDTRKDLGGKLFLALRGDHFDAHDFLFSALEKGAAGMIVDRVPEGYLESDLGKKTPLILVKDTLKALQDMAQFWRRLFSPQVIAITGSVGKTTTKEFTSQMLSSKYNTLLSPGSFNNHWGVPLTLLMIQPEHEKVVLEMGMNHRGELTQLALMAEPEVVLVTNVGSAHIGELGSQEAVAQAKWELYRSCPQAQAIFNLDNIYTQRMYNEAMQQHRMISGTFGQEGKVNLEVVEEGWDFITVEGKIGNKEGRSMIPVFGQHNVYNVMAAASIALCQGMTAQEIWKELGNLKTTWGRNQVLSLPLSGTRIMFDAYNANPDSMRALFENVSRMKIKGKKILVLGEMLELGQESARFHEELGQQAAEVGADVIWFMGPHQKDFARGVTSRNRMGLVSKKLLLSDTYQEDLATQVASMLSETDIVAVKGSRGMHLERVLKRWGVVGI